MIILLGVLSPAAPLGSPRRPRPAEPLCPSPVAGQPGREKPSTAASVVGLWPTTSARPPSGSPATTCRSAEPSSQDSRSTRSGSMARMSFRSARLPAALAASRQRYSTEDRSPVAAVIGCRPGPPRAARFPASGWLGPRRWKRMRRRAGAARPGRSSRRLPLPVVSGDHPRYRCAAQFHVPHERVLPRRDAVMLVIAITPAR